MPTEKIFQMRFYMHLLWLFSSLAAAAPTFCCSIFPVYIVCLNFHKTYVCSFVYRKRTNTIWNTLPTHIHSKCLIACIGCIIYFVFLPTCNFSFFSLRRTFTCLISHGGHVLGFTWFLLCETGLSFHLNWYFCYQMANGVCKHLLFQHLITDKPNRSLMNAMSVCVQVGGWGREWVTDNSKRGRKKLKRG